MRKTIAIIATMLMTIALTGCTLTLDVDPPPPDLSEHSEINGDQQNVSNGQNADELAFDGRIVIITTPNPGAFGGFGSEFAEDEYLSAEALVNRFGQERVVHKTWSFLDSNVEKIVDDIFREINEDPEVRSVVLFQTYTDESYLIDALENLRDDIFVVYLPFIYSETVDYDDIRADLIIQTCVKKLGEAYVMQAISMGAHTIAHYSNPLHRAVPVFSLRRDAMKTAAEREGIRFVDLEAPSSIYNHLDAVNYITQDLPRQVERLGVNTAFFGSSIFYQSPIISQTTATGAIFPLSYYPTPFFLYDEAFEIELRVTTDENDDFGNPVIRRLELPELLKVLDEEADAVDMAGRISSWAIPDNMMWSTIGFMYAVEWLNGNVPQERGVIDIEALARLAREYVMELGIDAAVTLENLVRDGETIGHYVLGIIDYHVFGSEVSVGSGSSFQQPELEPEAPIEPEPPVQQPDLEPEAPIGTEPSKRLYELERMRFGGIDWLVLDEAEGKVLLLSEFALFDLAYNVGFAHITWETSTIRAYLNDDFYYSFSQRDRERIAETRVVNNDKMASAGFAPYGISSWLVPAGNDTDDKIFLLSIEEVRRYITTRSDRVVRKVGDDTDWVWWLRSPGGDNFEAMCVALEGIDTSWNVNQAFGIRPALWLYVG